MSLSPQGCFLEPRLASRGSGELAKLKTKKHLQLIVVFDCCTKSIKCLCEHSGRFAMERVLSEDSLGAF